MKLRYDFSGWATRNDLVCADGRTIRQDAFKDCDGKMVPLVWNHQHNNPTDILGHALLENLEESVREVNGEEDLGIEGLRNLKERLRPSRKIEMYACTQRG